MKKILIALCMFVGAVALTGCERVEPGYVGIKVDRLGEDKGVGEVVGAGRQWTFINTDLYVFPTALITKQYEEPFYFQTSDGNSIGQPVAISYTVDPTRVLDVFKRYRKGVDEITDQDIRQKLSDALIRNAVQFNTEKFIDGGKETIRAKTLQDLQAEFSPLGINILSVSWMGKPEYPASMEESINAKVTANQRTLQRQQEIEQSKAEAEKERQQARGIADAKLIAAKAEAEALAIRGKALRENPEVRDLEAINKWDGKLPVYMTAGAQTPLLNIKDMK